MFLNRNKLWSLGLGLSVASLSVVAADSASPSLTLRQVIDVLQADNAQLLSVNQKASALEARTQQAGALANPMVTYRGMDSVSGGQWPDTSEKRIEVEQAFPWPGKRTLARVMAGKEAAAMQFEAVATTLDLEVMAADTFYALHAVQQSLAITRSEEALLRRIESLARVRYSTGAAGQVDVLKAQTEITMLKQKWIELESRELTLKHRLNTLMNRPVDMAMGPLEVPAWRAPDEVESLGDRMMAKAVVNRPELGLAGVRIERAQAEGALMRKEGRPDYKVGLEYRSMPDEDQAMFMVGVELPIWRSRIGAGVRGADRMVESELAARESVARQVRLEVQDAVTQVQAAQRTLELTRKELVPQAESQFSASEAAYQSGGKGDFMALLESQRFLLKVRLMGVMAESELRMQWARLARAVGVSVLEAGALALREAGR